jgi:hypothetical protein
LVAYLLCFVCYNVIFLFYCMHVEAIISCVFCCVTGAEHRSLLARV